MYLPPQLQCASQFCVKPSDADFAASLQGKLGEQGKALRPKVKW